MSYVELDKKLTAEEEAIKRAAHEFASGVLRPASLALDRVANPEEVVAEGSLFWDVFRDYYDREYHLAALPEALGGISMSPLSRHLQAEEFGWGSADFAVGLGVASFPFAFAALSGQPEIISDIVQPFVEDRQARYIGCWAITEPRHGSDTLMVGSPQFSVPDTAGDVRALRDGEGWVVRGQKSAWVSNGTIGTHALVFLSVDPQRGPAAGGVAAIPLSLPGVTRGKPLDKLGQRALNQGEIFFDEVRIPIECMLVGPEGYSHILDSVLAGANAFMGATFTGLARAALEEALGYARQRVQGGKAISEHQAVQLKLANMFIEVEASRALSRAAMVYNATASPPSIQHSIASKVFCTQAAFQVASEAVQVFGGYGLAKGVLVEKLFRDARAALIEDGTNEVMSLTAARKVIDGYAVDNPAHARPRAVAGSRTLEK
jgi:alkylation response protein AidB-like acyl-CoA dehydrogenase